MLSFIAISPERVAVLTKRCSTGVPENALLTVFLSGNRYSCCCMSSTNTGGSSAGKSFSNMMENERMSCRLSRPQKGALA